MADDDYELLPREELERLRNQATSKKKIGMAEGRTDELFESIERLNNSITKLIRIFEDAQQDIIDEYMNAKPTEKINKIVSQNDAIARALLAINDKVGKADMPQSTYQQYTPPPQQQQYTPSPQFSPPQQFMQPPTAQPPPLMQPSAPQNNFPSSTMVAPTTFAQPGLDDNAFGNLPPLDDLPSMDNLPPPVEKKKFLGFG